MQKKVLVAMSGGVDSSLVAALLKEQGFEVTGVTMSLYVSSDSKNQAVSDASSVAKFLSIPYFVLDLQKDFKEIIISDFFFQYSLGNTPNPCVLCNQEIKFGLLYQKAKELGFDYLATGHYVRKFKNQQNRYTLTPAADTSKDQRYYLYRLSQEVLRNTLFLLGEYTKEEVRKLAKERKLSVAEKKDSQDICFIEQNDYRSFLKKNHFNFQSGNILNHQKEIIAHHKGKENYTIGQRKGLGISAPSPLYVSEICFNGDIVVASKEQSMRQNFFLKKIFYMAAKNYLALKNKNIVLQIRYQSKFLKAQVSESLSQEILTVQLEEKVQGITPGQSCVLYFEEDLSIAAGGIIALH